MLPTQGSDATWDFACSTGATGNVIVLIQVSNKYQTPVATRIHRFKH